MIKFIDSVSVINKKIIMRVDFNVPLTKENKVRDNFRIKKVVPTIKYLLDNKAQRIVLLTHLGRPTPEDRSNPQYSLKSVGEELENILQKKVYFFSQPIDSQLIKKINELPVHSLALLENIRFYPGENSNDKSFAKKLASLGNIFINDAFSVSQRSVASLCAITEFIPSYGGLLLKQELQYLNYFLDASSPYLLILGGAKVKEKLPLIKKFYSQVDSILVGGVVANTIYKILGEEIGQSLVGDSALIDKQSLKQMMNKLVLPIDWVVKNKDIVKHKLITEVESLDNILDIGEESQKKFSQIISSARTIIWNGPMGKVEEKSFQEGTRVILQSLLSNRQSIRLIGGGDTLAAWRLLKPRYDPEKEKTLFFSTGGGAMLKYLAGDQLPGLQALSNNK